MRQGKAPIVRKNVSFNEATIAYVEALARTGTHASDVSGVIRSLVEEGVRNAIRDGLLPRPKHES